MKKIKFDSLQKNWWYISLIVIAFICMLFGFLEIFKFENPNVNKIFSIVGHLSIVLFFSRMFWYKNYVQWNKKGIVLRINSFLGKTFTFEDIKETLLCDEKLNIYMKSGEVTELNLSGFDKSDILKLNEIFNKYCC